MKKTELKKLLKPLIKECIKEVIFEDGVLSGIISEVTKGVSAPSPIVAAAAPKEEPMVERMRRNAFSTEQSTKLKEQKNKLKQHLDAPLGRPARRCHLTGDGIAELSLEGLVDLLARGEDQGQGQQQGDGGDSWHGSQV